MQQKVTKDILTIPNIISVLRLFVGIPLCLSIVHDRYAHMVLFGTIVIISDYFDGYLSRKLNQRSELGQVIDPIVDFLIVFAIVGVMVWKNLVPLWFMSLIILRYCIIASMLYAYTSKTQKIPRSVFSGKLSMCFIALTLVTAFAKGTYPVAHYLSMAISVQLMLASTLDYHSAYLKTKS